MNIESLISRQRGEESAGQHIAHSICNNDRIICHNCNYTKMIFQ